MGKCIIGGAILLVSGGLDADDSYVISRHVSNPQMCQQIATEFNQRFHFKTWCLMEIPAIKGDRLK